MLQQRRLKIKKIRKNQIFHYIIISHFLMICCCNETYQTIPEYLCKNLNPSQLHFWIWRLKCLSLNTKQSKFLISAKEEVKKSDWIDHMIGKLNAEGTTFISQPTTENIYLIVKLETWSRLQCFLDLFQIFDCLREQVLQRRTVTFRKHEYIHFCWKFACNAFQGCHS